MDSVNAMDTRELNEHLSQINTLWSTVIQAHTGCLEVVSAAQQRLFKRYSPAIYKYLLGAVGDAHEADELFQEFALRFVRGDFKRAHRSRGRFRQFLKTALFHLVVDHRRRKARQPVPLALAASQSPAEEWQPPDSEGEFLDIWREQLLTRTWEEFEQLERQTGQILYSVLRLRADHPDLQAPQMAERLSARLGKPLTPAWVRKRLHLAREKFADLFIAEVSRSLKNPHSDELEQELLELGLLNFCRPALERRRQDVFGDL